MLLGIVPLSWFEYKPLPTTTTGECSVCSAQSCGWAGRTHRPVKLVKLPMLFGIVPLSFLKYRSLFAARR